MRTLRRLFAPVIIASVVTLGGSIGYAQAPAGPPQGRGGPAAAPRNLQVLASETPAAEVQQIMQAFTAALGVQCVHCHVQPAAAQGGRGGGGRGGRGGAPALDFASDEKPQKAVARQMMRMVGELGPRVAAAAGRSADAAAEVTCITCHRGVPVPKQLQAILDETTAEKGTPAAIARYKELRRQFFGAQAYDFTQGTLLAYAQRATQANTPEEAIAWLQLNLEYFPLSSPTYVALAQAHQKANDKAAAVKALERAVELDPQNAQTKRQLDQLKGVATQVGPSQ